MPTTPKLPTFDLAKLPTCSAGAVREAAFVGVGMAAMAFEQVQVASAKLVELVTAGVARARAATTN